MILFSFITTSFARNIRIVDLYSYFCLLRFFLSANTRLTTILTFDRYSSTYLCFWWSSAIVFGSPRPHGIQSTTHDSAVCWERFSPLYRRLTAMQALFVSCWITFLSLPWCLSTQLLINLKWLFDLPQFSDVLISIRLDPNQFSSWWWIRGSMLRLPRRISRYSFLGCLTLFGWLMIELTS